MTDYPGFVIDSSALIDYQKTDDSILHLFTQNIGAIYLAEPVFADELKELSMADCQRLGILVSSLNLNQLIEAAGWQGSISKYDACSLILARENNWTVITSDKPLISRLRNEHIPFIWGLRPMIMLVSAGCLAHGRAIQTAENIRTINPSYLTSEIINKFKIEINKL
jgi:rRNA-processing protein FCF1